MLADIYYKHNRYNYLHTTSMLLIHSLSTDYVDCLYIPHGPSPLAVVLAWLYTQRLAGGRCVGLSSAL